MDDVSEEVHDITVNIDTVSPKIPPEILELGKGVNVLHEESGLQVTRVEIESNDYPPHFCIEGRITGIL